MEVSLKAISQGPFLKIPKSDYFSLCSSTFPTKIMCMLGRHVIYSARKYLGHSTEGENHLPDAASSGSVV